MTDPGLRTVVADNWGEMADRLDGLGATGWDRATGLAGWSVADLAGHAVWGVSMEARALRRAARGETGLADGLRVDLDRPSGVVAALCSARDDLLAAIDASAHLGDDAVVPLAAGEFPMGLVRPILAMEGGVHTDDLRTTLGIDHDLAPVVVASSLTFFREFVPILGGLGESPPPVGTRLRLVGDTVDLTLQVDPGGWVVSTTVDDDVHAKVRAGDTSIVRCLFGRPDPRADDREVTGDVALVAGLKRWLPGP